MMNKRTFGKCALVATMAAVLVACGKKEEAAPAAGAATELTVAYITNGNTTKVGP